MKFLLLIPSEVKSEIDNTAKHGSRPTMDYQALAEELSKAEADEAEIIDYLVVDAATGLFTRLARRFFGRDAAMAVMAFQNRNRYDAVYSNGENVGIPFALLLKLVAVRPGHVMIGHRLSTGKKRLFFTALRVGRQIDHIFVYATSQLVFATGTLGLAEEQVHRISFQVDDTFFCPQAGTVEVPKQICAAGLEWRDYPMLIDAVRARPDLTVKLAAASPWSKHQNETENRDLPSNVSARRYSYAELRDLYAESSVVAVPLYENDFQAGITTILEAMSMAKPVVVTKTTGQTDVIADGVTGLYVSAGDASGWQAALSRLLGDENLRNALGSNAREWVVKNGGLSLWVNLVAAKLRSTVQSSSERASRKFSR